MADQTADEPPAPIPVPPDFPVTWEHPDDIRAVVEPVLIPRLAPTCSREAQHSSVEPEDPHVKGRNNLT